MPSIQAAKVRCAQCDRLMDDPLKPGYTCPYCGCSPVPSVVYPLGSPFRPRTPQPLAQGLPYRVRTTELPAPEDLARGRRRTS